MTRKRARVSLAARVESVARTIAQVLLKTALVIVDALSTGPGSATSSVTHLPVVLPRRHGDEMPVPPRRKPRFRRRRRRSN